MPTMIGRDENGHRAHLGVELRPESDGGTGRRYTAWAGGQLLARVAATEDQGRLRVAVAGAGATLAQWDALVGTIVAQASFERLSGVVLLADSNLLLRHAARAAGFAGPLRENLVSDFRSPGPPVDRSVTPTDKLLSELAAWLPAGVSVSADRRAGRLRSLVRSASSGVTGTVRLTVVSSAGGQPLRLAVPIGNDLLAEGVALAVDTALAIRRRFSPRVDRVRIFFDQSTEGLRTGTMAGAAYPSVRDIHLSPSYVSGDEMQAQQRRHGAEASSRVIPAPFTAVDYVVAHEYWHQIENGFESGRYRQSVEFRRAVGGYFGVETLEQVIKGGAATARPEWQVARTRLAAEVSAYAATAPKEATAELFSQWWCTASAPPPSAQAFGEVLRRFFPLADLER